MIFVNDFAHGDVKSASDHLKRLAILNGVDSAWVMALRGRLAG